MLPYIPIRKFRPLKDAMSGQSSGQTIQEILPNPPPLTANTDAAVEVERGATPKNSHSSYHEIKDHLGEDAVAVHDEAPYRRHKPRNSGGFLLQGTPASTSNSARSRDIDPEISENVRGKRKVVEGDIHVPKRGTAHHRHRQRTSLGGSPLATEVVNVHSADHRDGSGASASNRPSSEQSTKAHSTRSGLTSNGTSTESTSIMGDAGQNSGRGTIGLDTDPAQIINLALNLSESRRRNVSSGGLFPPRDGIGARRLVSPVPPTLSLTNNAGAGGSLRQHLQQQRRASRNLSPRSSGSIGGRGSDAATAQKERSVRQQPTSLPDFETGLNGDIVFKASNATLARAEKARVTFELCYEYRRLLQYLPVLPGPVKSRMTTGKTMRSQAYAAQELGRVYNPLQYIRNRKLRIREREPLDAEGNGWNNIEHVRAWVNEVISQREDGISRVDKRFPLPSFEQSPSGPPQINDLQAQNNSHPLDPQAKRPGRPHMDWIVTPWDLLADANWLHQDDNVKRIVDREGQPLIPRGDPPREDRPSASMDFTRGSVRKPESLLRHINSSPERLRASLDSFRSDSKDRGRRQAEVSEPKSPVSDNDSFQRKSRWPQKLMRSRSSSSSGESHHARRRRHKRGRDHLGSRDDLDDAALEKQMMGILAKEANDRPEAVERVDHLAIEDMEPKPSQTDQSKDDGKPSQPTQHRPSTPQRMKTDMPAKDRYTNPARASLDEQRLQHYRMSSDDLDSTVPNSPTTPGFIPSIAINLSPPDSPQAATESPLKKTLSGRIGSFRRNRSQSVNRRAVSENTAVTDSGTSTDVSRQTTNDSQPHNILSKERSMHLGNGFLSPAKADPAQSRHRPLENKSVRSIKETGGVDSRFKGLFKGGRIAEIVGNEVSRVGDMLWKKDSTSISDMHSEVSSLAPEESDIDEGDISGLENSPGANLSRVTTTTEGTSKLSRASTNSERPRYHISNLPSFRSPFNKEEQTPGPTKLAPEHDHITRQQIALRERGRSSRFDRLAPPKINMRGISPSPSRSPSPNRQHLRVSLDEDTREGSRSRSAKRVHSADKRLNAILAIPGSISSGSAPSGLAGTESGPENMKERPGMEGKRHWSIADRDVSTAQEAITKRDIARVRALLLSSGVKANEIARRAEEIPEQPSPILLDLVDLFKGSIPEVSRSKEHVIAARILVSTIDTTTQRLRYSAEQFSRKTVENLHDQIKAIDERVTYKLTPLVRDSADDADNLSTELTTTHTLAVKQLNDSIDGILRRRRRRLRWVRRGGWAMLEWTLLAIMWMIWFCVVIVRLIRCVVGGFVRAVRWFFWL